jgi:hypothetical protein
VIRIAILGHDKVLNKLDAVFRAGSGKRISAYYAIMKIAGRYRLLCLSIEEGNHPDKTGFFVKKRKTNY